LNCVAGFENGQNNNGLIRNNIRDNFFLFADNGFYCFAGARKDIATSPVGDG